MRAVQIERPGVLRLLEVPAPRPGPHDALVDIAFSGICGSDVDIVAGQRPANFVTYPVIPGHEWSGTVVEVGDRIDPALVGRKVVGEGFASCNCCRHCENNEAVLCETRYDEIGFTRPGAWAHSLVIPADQLHVLNEDADLQAAACLEPAACAADAVTRAAVQPGETVAVVGAGSIGILVVQLLGGFQPSEIVVVEPADRAAQLARQCGATATREPSAVADLAGRFDVVFETAGAPSTAKASLDLVRRGGRVVLVGIPEAGDCLDVAGMVSKRVQVETVFGAPSSAWKIAVDAFNAGTLKPGVLVTQVLDLADAERALRLQQRSPGSGKILLKP